MAGIIRVFVIGLVLCIPLPRIWRSQHRLSWAQAVVMGTYLVALALLFIAEIPSRLLYYVDSRSGVWTEQFPILRPVLDAKGAGQTILADIVANTVQAIFFVIIIALVWFWGEKQRKAGRFSRR